MVFAKGLTEERDCGGLSIVLKIGKEDPDAAKVGFQHSSIGNQDASIGNENSSIENASWLDQPPILP